MIFLNRVIRFFRKVEKILVVIMENLSCYQFIPIKNTTIGCICLRTERAKEGRMNR